MPKSKPPRKKFRSKRGSLSYAAQRSLWINERKTWDHEDALSRVAEPAITGRTGWIGGGEATIGS